MDPLRHNPSPAPTDAAALSGGTARPVGREREREQLRRAFDAASSGACRVFLVAGASGVGKSSLIDELRPLVHARNGRYVSGKFDPRSEREASVIVAALGVLGGFLLAEHGEEERARLRGRILRTLGAQAGLARVVPEFAQLLADVPEPRAVDPAHAAARMAEVVTGLLKAIASPEQPLVLVLDDLHWSGAQSTRLIEAVLDAPDLAGLLLIGAYRDDELPASHPLAACIARRAATGNGPQVLVLDNLSPQEVAQLLMRALGVPAPDALALAEVLAPHAHGNPCDTIDLVNALRDDGLLATTGAALRWDETAVREYLAHTHVGDVLAARIARLPASVRELLQALACMGTQTSREVARAAVTLVPGKFEQAVAMLREKGFLLGDADGVLRLRHDRVLQAAYGALPAPRRGELHLGLARRLSRRGSLANLAGDQYVSAVDEVRDPAECNEAGGLLRGAAAQARREGNHYASCGMLRAALQLLEQAVRAGGGLAGALAGCEIELHAALYSVGHLEEADAVYRRIEMRQPEALVLAGAACVQVGSMSNRGKMREAIDLGLNLLRRLQVDVPHGFAANEDFAPQFRRLRRWVEAFDRAQERARPEVEIPWVVAAARMLDSLFLPAFYVDLKLHAWVIFQSQELWERHGPCAPLVVNVGGAGIMTVSLRQDRRTGYLAARHVLDLCEARGWEPETSGARYMFLLTCVHWFEPLERRLGDADRAREGLLAGGDLRNASFCYRQSTFRLFESGPSLGRFAQELEGASVLARRANNRLALSRCQVDRQLLRTLRGECAQPGSFDDGEFSEAVYLKEVAGNPVSVANYALQRAIACAIFSDGAGLSRYARWALDRVDHIPGLYMSAWAYWLGGLAAAWQGQHTAGELTGFAVVSAGELDAGIEWLRERAIDSPLNFRHMHLHLLAERAWARGEPAAAARAFDEALGALEASQRPWHQALIAERAGRFHQSQGWEHSGLQLLGEARQIYAAWGATAKAGQPGAWIGSPASGVHQALVSGTQGHEMDTRAVLHASQALSLERSPARLKAKVEEVLGGMTGATRVELLMWDEDAGDWPARGDGPPLPLSVLRYVQRTGELLLLQDALCDDRFARDPYFGQMALCSLMVVPIVRHARMRAMLMLENPTRRGVFGTERLGAVTIIAGQLAVALESAQLYEGLERKVGEQTRQLREAQERLVEEARRSGMAQIATNVLHNVGNLLTSVNVSAHVLAAQVRQSRAARVDDVARLLRDHETQLARFFAPGGKGRLLPGYLRELAGALESERERLLEELQRLAASVDHIKNVVAMQQAYAGASRD